ncbi:MAG: hypothetical protein E6J73_11500, partial [Deltaproteobacteria bacterium]
MSSETRGRVGLLNRAGSLSATAARPVISCRCGSTRNWGSAKNTAWSWNLLGGSIQLTQTAASSALLGAIRGAPVVIVATLENKLPMQLISRPEIKEPHQLRGKTIGINRFGGSNDAAVLMAVKAWKMDPKDISMLQTGGTSARMAALISKKVDATVQSYPEIYQAKKLGMNVLADIGDFGYFTNTSNIVTRAYLQQNRTQLKGFIKGQIEGVHYVKTNKEGSLKILRKYLQITDNEAV